MLCLCVKYPLYFANVIVCFTSWALWCTYITNASSQCSFGIAFVGLLYLSVVIQDGTIKQCKKCHIWLHINWKPHVQDDESGDVLFMYKVEKNSCLAYQQWQPVSKHNIAWMNHAVKHKTCLLLLSQLNSKRASRVSILSHIQSKICSLMRRYFIITLISSGIWTVGAAKSL